MIYKSVKGLIIYSISDLSFSSWRPVDHPQTINYPKSSMDLKKTLYLVLCFSLQSKILKEWGKKIKPSMTNSSSEYLLCLNFSGDNKLMA